MKRALVIVALAACSREHAPPAAEDHPAVQVIGCELAWRPTADAVELAPVVADPPPTKRDPLPAAGGGGVTVDVHAPNVVGGLGGNAVRRTLLGARDALEHCYAARLASRPGLAGNVDLDFTIGPEGKITTPSSNGLDRALGQCFLRVLHTLDFTKPRGGGAKVRVTLVVHPEASDTPDEPVDEVVVEAPPAPTSVLESLTWADDGADAGLTSWARELAAPSLAAVDVSACALGATGTVRATFGVDRAGKIVASDFAGVGNAPVEDCLEHELSPTTIPPPPTEAALRCEVVVGAPAPARVTVRDGMPVLDVGADVELDGAVVADLPAALARLQADGAQTVIVRTGGATDVAKLAAVTAALAARQDPYVVGVEDATGGLTLVTDMARRGAGRPRATMGPRPRVTITNGRLIASVDGEGVIATGALGDPASARGVLAQVAACGACERIVEVVADAGVEARWLGEVATWSAEAGLPRIVLGTR